MANRNNKATCFELHFTNADPNFTNRKSFKVLRPQTKNSQHVRAIILSPQIYGCQIHWRGRTIPCSAHTGECEVCNLGQQPRWIGYVAAWNIKLKELALLEITAGCSQQIEDFRKKIGTLRGVHIEIERQGEGSHGKLLVADLHVVKQDMLTNMPAQFDVPEILYRLWKLHPPKSPEQVAAAERRQELEACGTQPLIATARRVKDPPNGNGDHLRQTRLFDALIQEGPYSKTRKRL